MDASEFHLRVARESSPGQDPRVWRAAAAGDAIVLTRPDGSQTQVPASPDAVAVLTALAEADPALAVIPPFDRVDIECPPAVESVLPLWLTGARKGSIGGTVENEYLETIEDSLAWVDYSTDHCVFVNGRQWAAISSAGGGPDAPWIIVPIRGDWYEDWFESVYASFGFTETGSMTSGWDASLCGLITSRVLSTIDKFDEGETYVTVREATDPVAEVRAWLRDSELADQLRRTWDIPFEDDDFLEWGFLQLALSGATQIELRGLDPSHGDMLGVGLTASSKWTFTSSLSGDQLRQVVGEMSGRRPGSSPGFS